MNDQHPQYWDLEVKKPTAQECYMKLLDLMEDIIFYLPKIVDTMMRIEKFNLLPCKNW